jgi:hypothetical protein
MLLDPVKEIAKSLPRPWQDPNYHHDGECRRKMIMS